MARWLRNPGWPSSGFVEAGPSGLPAGQIAEHLGIPPSSLSFHMKELTYANLVAVEQRGRYMIYSANYAAMNDLLGYLTENCCGGNPCTPAGGGSCKPSKENAS